MRSLTFFALLCSFATLILVAPLAAQDGFRRYSPDRLERKTEKDEQGLLQWKKWEAPRCPTCAGKGKTKCKVCERFRDDAPICPDCHRSEDRLVFCRTCLGTGSMPDPLDVAQCPTCLGGGFMLCTVCGGGGQLRVGEGNPFTACPACRGKGGFPCGTCGGKRTVEMAALKPSLRECEDLKKIDKALAVTEKVLAGLEKFKPKGGTKVRKEVKALLGLLKNGQKLFPPFKRAQKTVKNYMGKIYSGNQFVGHEEQQQVALELVKAGCEYYLKQQKRMLELVRERAEINQKVRAEQKGR